MGLSSHGSPGTVYAAASDDRIETFAASIDTSRPASHRRVEIGHEVETGW